MQLRHTARFNEVQGVKMSQLTDNQTISLGFFACLKQNSFINLLISSLSAHGIFIAFAAFYLGAYLALIQYFPPAKPKAYLLMFGGMLVSNFAFALFALLFHRIYNVARFQKPHHRNLEGLLEIYFYAQKHRDGPSHNSHYGDILFYLCAI